MHYAKFKKKKKKLAIFLQLHYMRWLSGKEFACNAGDAV